MAFIDIPGFVADLKDHAADHGFHVHDERHFVETYSLRQAWEVDLHPERACGGPLDLHVAVEMEPRVLLAFEDRMLEIPEEEEPPTGYALPMVFNWALPPLPKGPDLLVLATDLAGIGGPELPIEISAIDSTASVTDAPERTLSIAGRMEIDFADLFMRRDNLCDTLDRCHAISEFVLDRSPAWLDEI